MRKTVLLHLLITSLQKIPDAKIKKKKLIHQSDDVSNFVKNYVLNTKLATRATKAELKAE